ARKKHRVAEGELIAAPHPGSPAACVLVTRLPEKSALVVTVLNFGESGLKETVRLAGGKVAPGNVTGKQAVNAVTGAAEGKVTKAGELTVEVPAWAGKTLIVGG